MAAFGEVDLALFITARSVCVRKQQPHAGANDTGSDTVATNHPLGVWRVGVSGRRYRRGRRAAPMKMTMESDGDMERENKSAATWLMSRL